MPRTPVGVYRHALMLTLAAAAGLVRREDGAMVQPSGGEIVKYEPS